MQVLRSVEKILAVGPAPAHCFGDDMCLLFQRQTAAILIVFGINHVSQCPDLPPVDQPNGQVPLQIRGGDQFAFAQIGDGRLFCARRRAQGQPLAMCARLFIQRKNKAGVASMG